MLLVEEQLDSHSTESYKVDYMPKLLTNGCSITLGAELGEETRKYWHKSSGEEGIEYQHCDTDYRHRERWSTKLADKLDMEPRNLARGGGSNWRTWRTTQDYLLENTVSLAVIQMTEPSRFQIPISLDFIKKWNPTKVTPTFEDWATGGIYAPDADLGGRYEEYSHWNFGEQRQLMSYMMGDIHESHYKNMSEEITGFFLINDQIQNFFDYLRQILYLHNMFVYYNIPHLIVDMLEGMTVCSLIKEELEKITELPENVMLLKFQQNKWELQETTGAFDKEIGEHYVTWFKYVKKSQMSKKFNKLYNAVISLKEFDGHPYRNYFSKVTRNSPQRSNDMYIGEMPGGHPNEQCHTIFAERMYNEIMNRSIL